MRNDEFSANKSLKFGDPTIININFGTPSFVVHRNNSREVNAS
jgi:hypothetical protein